MSTFIRRYSRYLNEKAMSYRLAAVDFTKMKRGCKSSSYKLMMYTILSTLLFFTPFVCVCVCFSADGVMRTMNTEKLIKTLPIIQNQLDALLDFQVSTKWVYMALQKYSYLFVFFTS